MARMIVSSMSALLLLGALGAGPVAALGAAKWERAQAQGLKQIRKELLKLAKTYFFLHGEDRKYRAAFIKLLEVIHKVHDQPGTFDRCFADVDTENLQSEFLDFVAAIKRDP